MIEFRCKDSNISNISNENDEYKKYDEEEILKKYTEVKNNDTYIHLQLQPTNDKNWKNWDNEEIDTQSCHKLSSRKCIIL